MPTPHITKEEVMKEFESFSKQKIHESMIHNTSISNVFIDWWLERLDTYAASQVAEALERVMKEIKKDVPDIGSECGDGYADALSNVRYIIQEELDNNQKR